MTQVRGTVPFPSSEAREDESNTDCYEKPSSLKSSVVSTVDSESRTGSGRGSNAACCMEQTVVAQARQRDQNLAKETATKRGI